MTFDYSKETKEERINNALGPIKTYLDLAEEYNTSDTKSKEIIKDFLQEEAKKVIISLKTIEKILLEE